MTSRGALLPFIALLLIGCGGDDDRPAPDSDAGRATDAGRADAGRTDAGRDDDAGAAIDGGPSDDAGTLADGGGTDAGRADAGRADAGRTDAGGDACGTLAAEAMAFVAGNKSCSVASDCAQVTAPCYAMQEDCCVVYLNTAHDATEWARIHTGLMGCAGGACLCCAAIPAPPGCIAGQCGPMR